MTYAWNQTAGASVTLSDASSATPTFTAPDVGANGDTLTFELTVNDTSGQTATDSVNVNVSSDGDSVSPQNLIDRIFQSYLPHLFIIVVFLVITVPFVLDMILAYRKIPAGGSGSKRALGMPGLNRSVMTFGIITLLGTVIFYLLALITLNMDNAGSPAFQALIGLLRNLGIILGTALATIIAFYFGVRGTESAVEKAAAVTESISPTRLRDVKGPPKILYTMPEDGDEEVPVTALIDVTFSEPMSSASINRSSFTVIRKGDPKPIPGVISLTPDAKTAQFDPDGDLNLGTTYIAEINQEAKDLAGTPLVATHKWSFTTAADNTPPTIDITSPADAATIPGPSTGVTVAVTGTASDESGGSGIQKVEVKVGSNNPFKLATTTGPGGSGDWSTWSASDVVTSSGNTTITARATDNAGNTKDATITVTVAFSSGGTEGGGGGGTEGGGGLISPESLGTYTVDQGGTEGGGNGDDERTHPSRKLYDGRAREGKPSPDLNTDIDQFPDLDISNIKQTIPCGTIKQLKDAIKSAQSGDLILLADGVHDCSNINGESFKIKGKKIERADEAPIIEPIIVGAQHVGGVSLTGSAGFRFGECTYFTWYGFSHTYGDNITFEKGNNNRFARCDVKLNDNGSERNWLYISNCKAMKVDHCKFHEKKTKKNFCNVSFDSDNEVGNGPLIEYNYFHRHDLPNTGDSGGEAVKIGDSKQSRKKIRAIFRYNLLEECNGDDEVITNKSCCNVYYGNSFVNNNATLTLRNGDTTAVLGNYFENCGLRICGADNLIANNHFTLSSPTKPQRGPIVLVNGEIERPDENKGYYERVVDNTIILNTLANGEGKADFIVYWGFEDSDMRDEMAKEKKIPLKPNGVVFRGNILTGKNGELLKFINGAKAEGEVDLGGGKEETISNTISDNIAWPTGNAQSGNLNDRMATLNKDPKLTWDKDGRIYRLESGSPARNKFQGTPFEELTKIDIDGEERGPNTDAGCDQYSTGGAFPAKPKKHLRLEGIDVGTKATIDLGDSPVWNPLPLQARED